QQLVGAGSGLNVVTGRVDLVGVGFVLRGGEPAGRVTSAPIVTNLSAILRSVLAVADECLSVPDTVVNASTVLCDPILIGGAPS
ncbi:MAG: hypothetical protein ACRDPG_14130, partial [Nocardioidaceae bacterium]